MTHRDHEETTARRGARIDDEHLVEPGRGFSLRTGASHIRLFDHRVAALSRGEGRVIALLAVAGAVMSGLAVLQAVLVAQGLASVFADDGVTQVVVWLVAAVAVLVARLMLMWIYEAFSASSAGRVAGRLRKRLYKHLTDLGPGWSVRQRSGALQATLVDGVEAIEAYFRLFVAQVAASMLTVLSIAAALAFIDPLIAVLVGALVLLAAVGPAISWRLLGTELRHWWTVAPALSSEFVDSAQGSSTLKIFGASQRRHTVLRQRVADVLKASMRLNWVEHAYLQPFSLASAAAVVVAIWLGIVRHDDGALSTVALLTVLMLVGEALRPVAETRRALHFAMSGMGAAEGVLDILDTSPAALPGRAQVGQDSFEGPTPVPVVEFEDVTLRYRSGDDPALDEFSLMIGSGQRVALVGPSGAGKTTVVSVLLRLFVPQSGTVRLAGVDVADLDLDSLRRTIALVPQDAYLFSGSIAHNLRLARPSATEDEMLDAMRRASGAEILDRLPEGLDSEVGERGTRLSGGERQRIAIARAFLCDAPVLVLDEATSNVDVESERTIQAALDHLAAGRTVLQIAHRLSTVRDADRIVVLDRGRLVDAGTHEDLAARPGRYRQMMAADQVDDK